MEQKDQIIQEYLTTGCGYRKLQEKYGISRTTICKWVWQTTILQKSISSFLKIFKLYFDKVHYLANFVWWNRNLSDTYFTTKAIFWTFIRRADQRHSEKVQLDIGTYLSN